MKETVNLAKDLLPRGPGVVQRLRHCATSRKVPGFNPGGVGHQDYFSRLPTEPCALGSTQPLKMSIRDLSWDKGGRCVRLMTYHPCSAECQVFRSLNLPGLGPSGRPVVGDLYRYLYLLSRIALKFSNFLLIS
jgi:hypothetical protein